MISEAFLKRVLMFVGVILSGLITLIFISTPESLQVKVPDNLPTITTKSALNREFNEAKQFFESSIKTSVRGASLAAVISWSPNSKYVLANLRFTDPTGSRTKPYVLDLAGKQYIEVPNAHWIDGVSWAGSKMAYATENGYAVFDIASHAGETFGEAPGENQPVISADGSYVAYAENGIVIYSLKASKSIRLTDKKEDVPALWKTDNKTLIIFTGGNTNTAAVIAEVGGQAGGQFGTQNAKASLAEMYIGTRELKTLAVLPQLPRRAQWVSKDQLAMLTLGFDDGFFDYAYDFSNASLTLLAETSEGIAFTSIRDKEIGTFKGNKISIYDSHAAKVTEAKRVEKSRVANFSLLPSKSVLLVRESGSGYDSAVFDMATATETAIEKIWLPYAILAPNGRSAITVKEGNDAAHFIEIPVVS